MRTHRVLVIIVAVSCVMTWRIFDGPMRFTRLAKVEDTRVQVVALPVERRTTSSLETPIRTDRLPEFNAWLARYLAAPIADRPALDAEGLALAQSRRTEFLKTIVNDPRRALQEAVPLVVRQQLPPEVVALLEERVNARGSLLTYLSAPAVGVGQPPFLRYAKTHFIFINQSLPRRVVMEKVYDRFFTV